MKIEVEEKVLFLNNTLKTVITSYECNNNIAIVLYGNDDEIFTTASVNIAKLPKYQVAIKNYSWNVGIEKSLIEADIIENEVIDTLLTGHVEVPVFKLTNNVIKQIEQIEQ